MKRIRLKNSLGGRVFQEEGTVCAKALRQGTAWCVVWRTGKRPVWPKPGELAALGEGKAELCNCFLVFRPSRSLPVFNTNPLSCLSGWNIHYSRRVHVSNVPDTKGTFPGKKHKILLRVSKNHCLMKTPPSQNNIFLNMGDLNSLMVYYWVPQSTK